MDRETTAEDRALRADYTDLGGTKLGQRPVQHIELVVEINGVHGDPLIDVFPLWQRHSEAQVPTAQRLHHVLLHIVRGRSAGKGDCLEGRVRANKGGADEERRSAG